MTTDPGSGASVLGLQLPPSPTTLDDLALTWIEEAQASGHSIQGLHAALNRQAKPQQPQPSRHFLVADPDPDLAAIFAAELTAAFNLTKSCLAPATILRATEVGPTPCHILRGAKHPGSQVLIALVSRSKSLLAWVSTLLSALGFSADRVLLQNPRTPSGSVVSDPAAPSPPASSPQSNFQLPCARSFSRSSAKNPPPRPVALLQPTNYHKLPHSLLNKELRF